MLATVDKEVSPRREEGIPPYRLLALPAAYYKKLCRERLIPVQEPNQRSGWPLKFDCGRSDLPHIFRITLPAKHLSPFYPIRPEKYVDKPRFIWYIIQAIFCVHGPLVKRLRQRPLTPLTWVRFPHGSPFIVGVDDNEGPPVPIPNTEVKLVDVENTWLATAWDDRKMPTQIFLNSSAGRACDC